MRSLICTHPNVVMEILGLAPTNPRRNTSAPMSEKWEVETKRKRRCSFVVALFPLQATSRQQYGNEEETEWKRCCQHPYFYLYEGQHLP